MAAEETAPLLIDNRRRRTHRDSEILSASPIISETDESITIRRPVSYQAINGGQSSEQGRRTSAAINRYKYYNRLAPRTQDAIIMPNHVVPPEYYLVIPIKPEAGSQSSIITIFSIWNTMMGTSILSMPWALERAGFGTGIGIMVLFVGLTLYTAYRVMKSPEYTDNLVEMCDFADVCRFYLGRWGHVTSTVFSLITLLGASIVYWVLMSNFLYSSVRFIYDAATHSQNNSAPVVGNFSHPDLLCPTTKHHSPQVNASQFVLTGHSLLDSSNSSSPSTTPLINEIWHEQHTVPFFLILFMLPLLAIKSPTFFTKLNALGTLAVLYILSFVIYKAIHWGGVHANFSDPIHLDYIPQFQSTFPALSGVLALALFIHNCVLSIVRNQKHPENNGRDLTIAYFLVAFTYMFVAVAFYLCFPLAKSCIEDNLLNNFSRTDLPAFIARIFLFFQMMTVFPLIVYIFRVQFMTAVFGSIYPSWRHVCLLNAVMIAICLVFAVFYPRIGTIIRFSGALCGLVYVFTLPCVIYMMSLKRSNMLTHPVIAFHTVIILVGAVNFVAQFLLFGKD